MNRQCSTSCGSKTLHGVGLGVLPVTSRFESINLKMENRFENQVKQHQNKAHSPNQLLNSPKLPGGSGSENMIAVESHTAPSTIDVGPVPSFHHTLYPTLNLRMP